MVSSSSSGGTEQTETTLTINKVEISTLVVVGSSDDEVCQYLS